MKKYKIEIEMDDNFEKGCCHECPLYIKETGNISVYDGDYDDYYDDELEYCALDCEYENCPLKLITE